MNNEPVIITLLVVVTLVVAVLFVDRVAQKIGLAMMDERKRLVSRVKVLESRVSFLLEQLEIAQATIAQLRMEINDITPATGKSEAATDTNELNVLAVWSDAGGQYLDFSREIRLVRNARVNLVTLRGDDATKVSFVRWLSKRDFDIIQISAHGKDGTIIFNDGEVNPGWLESVFDGVKRIPQCVVLMACETSDHSEWSVSDALLSAKVPYVIGVSGSIDNIDAVTFVGMFYELVSHGQSFEQAFNRAKLIVSDAASEMIYLYRR